MTLDKTKNRNHVPWPNCANTGKGNTPLEEPVPKFLARKGDKVIKGNVDNNACIVLGRDRNPFGPPKSRVPHGSEEDPNNPKSSNSEVSGFSDHMGAGAIDIVVGRGAPFAMEKSQHDMFPQGLPPLYTTRSPVELTSEKLVEGVKHPGYIMDAARIYMSQMCQIDDYFKVKKVKLGNPIKEDKSPCSAIMMKADKLRMHSRRDIYIVAGGDSATTSDSNNNSISESGRIHLVAKNQNDPSVRNTTPAVRYEELKDCLKEIIEGLQGATEVLNTFLMMQKKLNHQLAHAVYGTAAGMTTQNPLCQATNAIVDPCLAFQLNQVQAIKTYNIPKIETNYLVDGGRKNIASAHITIN